MIERSLLSIPLLFYKAHNIADHEEDKDSDNKRGNRTFLVIDALFVH
jgi:hypothetical protein